MLQNAGVCSETLLYIKVSLLENENCKGLSDGKRWGG